MSERIGIVGGGLLGLSLADRLQKLGHAVTVFEAAPHFGGLASAWQLGDITWDRFYHVILLSDSHTHALLKELDLASEFVGVETKTGFYTDGKLYSMSNSVEFLKFPPLGLLSKLRLGLTIRHASKVTDWKALEQIPVVDWLRKWSGPRTTEKIWLPLLRAKLGESYRIASAAFIWATIARMYAARRSGMKKELFGYVRGGYATILERYVSKLRERGVELIANAPVDKIVDGPTIELASGEVRAFDRIIVTSAPALAVKLVPGLSDVEQAKLNDLTYQGIVCASVLLKKPLSRFYVTNLTDDWLPFTGVIEMTALVDPAEFGGRALVYLPKYVASDDPLFAEPDDSIRERFLAALERMHPEFERGDVLAFQLARVKHVFAVPTLNYSERVPDMKTSVGGVYLVNSSHIINGTLNVNETLQLAGQVVAKILNRGEAKERRDQNGSA